MLNRRAFSEVLYDSPRSTKLKEDARQVEFVRIGQALKLEAIVRGDAPTSLASAAGTASVFRRPPWEPQCFYAAFQARGASSIVGDSIGADGILVASDEGTFLIRDDQSQSMVFDRSLAVRQISVVEDHGLLLVRGGSPSNKDAHRMHCFRLDEFRPQPHSSGDDSVAVLATRSRADVRSRRMEKTRGCHLHTVARGPDGLLRMAVAVGRKVLTYQWRYSAAWAAWSPRIAEPKADVSDGWILVREQQMSEVPTILTILESTTERGPTICVGFKWVVLRLLVQIKHTNAYFVVGITSNFIVRKPAYRPNCTRWSPRSTRRRTWWPLWICATARKPNYYSATTVSKHTYYRLLDD